VLEGLPGSGTDAASFRAGLESELARLLQAGPPPTTTDASLSLASLPGGEFDLPEGTAGFAAGQRAAAALHRQVAAEVAGLTGPQPPPPSPTGSGAGPLPTQ
jgi:hypothetical protein